MSKEAAVVGSTPKGNRDLALNKLGYRGGQLIAAGLITRQLVVDSIRQAAGQNGFPEGSDLQNKLTKSIDDGIAKGPTQRDCEVVKDRLAQETRKEHKGTPSESSVLAGWKTKTFADVFKERPPVAFAIDKIFALPSLNMIVANPGSFKTWIGMDAATCVATGTPWLRPGPEARAEETKAFKVMQLPVMWIDYDQGESETSRRLKALATHYGANEKSEGLVYYSMEYPTLDAGNPESIAALIARIKDSGSKLVFIDNLALISGGRDENSSEMAGVMGLLRKAAEETQSAIVVLHHANKSAEAQSRLGNAIRGSSSIEASLDVALYLQRPEKEEERDFVRIVPAKVRSSSLFPFSAEFRYEKEGDRIVSACMVGTAGESGSFTLRREIKAILKLKGELNQGALAGAVKENLKVANSKVRDEVAAMVSDGLLSVRIGERNAHFYTLS